MWRNISFVGIFVIAIIQVQCDSNIRNSEFYCIACNFWDSACLQNPTLKSLIPCKTSSSQFRTFCFVKWNPDTGSNQRGCISTLEEENYCLRNPTLCSLCDGNEKPGCNSYEFPQNRRKCIQCDNKVTDDCPHTLYTETIEKYSKYCTQPTDDCMSICNGNVDNWNEACASDISENDNNYCRGNSACSRCKENNCNLISISECIPETPATTIPTSPPSPIVKIIVVASITIIVFIVLICFLRKKK